MSVAVTNSTNFMEFHGIKLAQGAAIANLVVERLASDPLTPEAGRFWYNTTENKFRLAAFNGTDVVLEAFVTATELASAVAAHEAALAASTGATLVGYTGSTGSNGQFSIVEGTLAAAVDALAAAVDAEIQARSDADTAAAAALAAQTVDASGSSLIGYDGIAGTTITVAAGTVADAIDSLATQVDTELGSLGDDAVSKTTLEDQTIASNLRVLQNVIIDGDVTINGTNTVVAGDTVSLGDNIILLNGELAIDAAPTMDAGWQVNRGTEGTLDMILWSEANKQLEGVTVSGEYGSETSVRSRVILGTEFDAFDTEVDTRLGNLESQIDGKIGDLTTLVTEDKTTLVAAVNELHADAVSLVSSLAAQDADASGASTVGYDGQAGANGLLSVAAGAVDASLDAIVTGTLGDSNVRSGQKGEDGQSFSFYSPHAFSVWRTNNARIEYG